MLPSAHSRERWFFFPRRRFGIPSSGRGRAEAELGSCLKNVVPVVARGPEALDGRMEGDHGAGHVLAGGIGVKATINEIALGDKGSQPARVGSSAGCRDAAVLGVEGKATDGVDGRLDEDDGWQRASGDGEEAEIFLRTWGQPVPGALGGAAQFGAHGLVFFSKEQENGIGSGVGVETPDWIRGSIRAGGRARSLIR